MDSQVTYPAASISYTTTPQRHVQWWHIALFGISIVMASVGVFAHLVLDNLQPQTTQVSSAKPLPSAPATLAVQVPEESLRPAENIQKTPLQTDVDSWIKAHGKNDWAVEVRQLDGDMSATTNAGKSFRIASLYKLFLLQPLANKIPSSGWSADVNGRSYNDCVDLMLRLSDNPCAEAIGSKLGWTYVDKYLRNLGYGDTHLGVGSATGTAHDTSLVLANLYNKNGFDEVARQLELASMKAPKKAEGIRKGCAGCTVYNKVGYIEAFKHDAAIIEKDGHVYTVVILSNGGSWQQISDLAAIINAHL